ncbi:hypothetical protein JQS30_06070 [Natronoglycomyces albus]|uniref:Tc1-like transposase DDE domain-containing protein n=1 Tax=Natronoglycomyces albus TaxID=2811108 RepID=A0A895XVB7_9ACTN|nr:transposase [Natronoglycomyces albus]QSB06466.1 hypothetical protein JQS30_06070 [Natronoglycomyces albus]
MSTISTARELPCTIFGESFNVDTFLDRLLFQFDQKTHLIVDGHSAHRAKIARQWVQPPQRIEPHSLLPYA